MAVQCLDSRSCARVKSIIHRFEFDYLKSKHMISFPPFTIGGYDWALHFYPNGSDSDQGNDESHASLYLKLLSETKNVELEFFFDILNKKGKLVPCDKPISHTFTWHESSSVFKALLQFIYTDDFEFVSVELV